MPLPLDGSSKCLEVFGLVIAGEKVTKVLRSNLQTSIDSVSADVGRKSAPDLQIILVSLFHVEAEQAEKLRMMRGVESRIPADDNINDKYTVPVDGKFKNKSDDPSTFKLLDSEVWTKVKLNFDTMFDIER